MIAYAILHDNTTTVSLVIYQHLSLELTFSITLIIIRLTLGDIKHSKLYKAGLFSIARNLAVYACKYYPTATPR